MKKIIQIRCNECKGIGLIKRKAELCSVCNELNCTICITDTNYIKLPPYYECIKCDGLGYFEKKENEKEKR